MSKNDFWAELDNQYLTKHSESNDFWAELDNKNIGITTQKEHTIGNRVASLGKSAVAGASGAIPDTVSALSWNLPSVGINLLREKAGKKPLDIPMIPSVTQAVNEGIDTATDGYTETPEDQKWLNQAVEFGVGFGGAGVAGKVANAAGKTNLARIANTAGSTNKLAITGAATAGGVSGALEDKGAGTSLAGGLVANTIVNNAPNLLSKGKGIKKSSLNKMRLSDENLDTAKAGRDLDINLPKSALTTNKIVAFADQLLSKGPISGDLMQSRHKVNIEKTIDKLNEIKSSVLSIKDKDLLNSKIKELYQKRDSILPDNAQVSPKGVIDEIIKIRGDLNKSASLSAGEKKVMSVLKDYEDRFAPNGIKGVPARVEDLVASKKSLNKIVNWKDLNIDWKNEDKAQNALKSLHKSINNDLSEYGKKNPEWFKYHKEADKLFTEQKKFEELESFFHKKVIRDRDDHFSYENLSTKINEKGNLNKLKTILDDENFAKVEKLAKVSKAMSKKSGAILNPSGTAPTTMFIRYIGLAIGGKVSLPATLFTVSGGSLAAHLLTDKKTLDLMIKVSENPTKKATVELSRRVKGITGHSPTAIARELSKQSENEQYKEGKSLRNKVNWDTVGETAQKINDHPATAAFNRMFPSPWKDTALERKWPKHKSENKNSDVK